MCGHGEAPEYWTFKGFNGLKALIFCGQQSTKDYRYICNGKKHVFYIPADKKGRILEILNRIGINKAYVYPEIDDVAEYIKSRVTET